MSEPATIYRIKISLADIKPPVWRRVETKDGSLVMLHSVIQTVMGWDNSHLWAFDIGGEQYGDDYEGDGDMLDASKTMLSRLVELGVKKFRYTYDFGDDWRHLIQFEKPRKAETGVKYPRCVEGERACPPEDCGGVMGYLSLLEALQGDPSPRGAEQLEWLGEDGFDPEAFDLVAVNQLLTRRR